MHRLLLPTAFMALFLNAAPLHAQTPGALPQGDGRDLAATACSQCHSLNVLIAGRDGPVGQYLDHGMSRRQLMTGLSALGMSAVAAKVGGAIAPRPSARRGRPARLRHARDEGHRRRAVRAAAQGGGRRAHLLQSVDRRLSDLRRARRRARDPADQGHRTKAPWSPWPTAMPAHRARPASCIVANIGLPNAMTQMVNSWKDQIPVMVAVASVEQDALGREPVPGARSLRSHDAADHQMVLGREDDGLDPGDRPPRHEVRRRPRPAARCSCRCRPTRCARKRPPPSWNQAKFDVPMRIRPDKDDIAKAARILLEAKNPLMSVGDEATWCRAGKELVEARRAARPSRHWAGRQPRLLVEAVPDPASALCRDAAPGDMRYPGKVDVLLNLGNKYGERAAPGTQLISIRLDPASLARGAPVDLGMVADVQPRRRRSGGGDPVDGDRDAGSSRSPRNAPPAPAPTPRRCAEFRQKIARENAERTPVSLERIGLELEAALDKDTCYVCDVDSGKTIDPHAVLRRQPTSNTSAPVRTCWAGAWRRRSAPSSRGRICPWSRSSATAASASPSPPLSTQAPLQGAGRQHRAQQSQLRRRRPISALQRRTVQTAVAIDLYLQRPEHRLCQGIEGVRRRGRGRRAGQAQRRHRARPAHGRRRHPIPRHPHLPRSPGRSLHLRIRSLDRRTLAARKG